MIWEKNGFLITDDSSKVDLVWVKSLLSQSYWASDRDESTIVRSVRKLIMFLNVQRWKTDRLRPSGD